MCKIQDRGFMGVSFSRSCPPNQCKHCDDRSVETQLWFQRCLAASTRDREPWQAAAYARVTYPTCTSVVHCDIRVACSTPLWSELA